MRYIYVSIFVVIAYFSSVSFAATGSVLTQDLDMQKVHNNKINNITIRFCNNGFDSKKLSNSLSMVLRPGQKKDVCVVLINKSAEPITILSDVVGAKLNEKQNFMCSAATGLSTNLVVDSFDQLSGKILLEPNQQIVKYFSLKTAKTALGNYYACLTVNLTTKEKLSNFNLLIRKAANMSISVAGLPYNYQWFDDGISFFKKNMNLVSKGGIGLFALLLIYSLSSLFVSKKKSHTKK